MKTDYCNANNIKLIRINYTELNRLNETYLKQLLL